MPAYNSLDFDPPAPVALVSFANLENGQALDNVRMLLDSGADASVVPQQVVHGLGAAEHATAYEIEHLEGSVATLSSVRLQMKWMGRAFTGDFLVAPTEYGVLGRNILNHIRIVLDGPQLNWEAG